MAQGGIILGDGVLAITTTSGATAIAFLSRGGGVFNPNVEYREISADGDYGPVLNRRRIVRSAPTMTLNLLEIVTEDMDLFLPGSTLTTTNSTAFTGSVTLSSADYLYAVTWTGETLDDRDVVVTVSNALPDGAFEFSFTDKEEVVPEITFTGHYTSSDRTTPPWSMTISTG
jgi:hypothetical protein